MNLTDILSSLTGKASAGKNQSVESFLDSLPEPPEELKEFVAGLAGSLSASLKGEKCPRCGKVHNLAAMVLGSPESDQTASYEESDGLANTFEYSPKEFRSVQFLPHNVPDVLEFLYDNEIPFGYAIGGDGSRILMITPGVDVDADRDELVYGKWAVVTGSRATGDIGYVSYSDAAFRAAFQKKSPATDADLTGSFPVAGTEERDLEEHADEYSKKAQRAALSAYGEDDGI